VHTVTKVLIVFAAVLCVLLAALTMAYSVNVDRITGDYQRQVDETAATRTSSATQQSQWVELQAKFQRDIEARDAAIRTLESEKATLEGERQALRKDKADAINARDEVMSKIDQATASIKTLSLLVEGYRTEVTKLREQELVYRKNEIELVDRINDLQSQNEVLTSSVRSLQETLVATKRQLDEAGGPVIGRSQATGPIQPSFPVNARVIETRTDKATGKPMATINVGTNNQVREHMQLVVVQNGDYVADFTVTRADLQFCEGTIDAKGKPVTVRAGDTVRSLVQK
jgi:hypothetical protein